MFDLFRNSVLVKVFLIIIVASFFYFGIGGLSPSNKRQYLVEIGDTRITNFDVQAYLQRNRQMQDEDNIKQAYIFLQKRAYLIEGGKKIGIEVPPNQLNQVIKSEPAFKDFNGNFDVEKYRSFINNTYHSDFLFEDEMKKNMIFTYMTYYLNNNHIISDYQLLQYLTVYETKKEIQSVSFPVADYQVQVHYNEDELKSFYEEHQEAYKQYQSVRFEYLHLTPDWMMKQVQIPEETLQAYYENNKGANPKRMVSHIVLMFPQSQTLDEQVKSSLRRQAELILEKVKQQPEKFADYAQKYSQDASTAQFGGSVGIIERNGQYYEAIEDAVFSLGTGQIHNQLVETEDGYHIIKVDAAMDWVSYDRDRTGIEYVLKYNQAKEKLITLRDELSEASFNESKDLHKVSEKELGLDIVQSSEAWVTKQQALLQGLPVEVIETLFDPISISDKSNSEVINVGDSYWIVRVIEDRPARLLDFNEVKQQVVNDYTMMKAGELALADVNKRFSQLSSGQNVLLNWTHPLVMSIEKAESDLSQEEYIKFLSTSPNKNGQPGYYLLDKKSQPTIVRVNSQTLDYPFGQEKIKLSFEKSRDMIAKKNEIAILAYFYQNIKRRQGNVSLDF
ncbi:MAG: hypothetical protein GKC53_04490 [Neisseriaceae bacterium]|nr:MAG: hypothetical protein GKC53_04490 [Neisseriaceae bacterium]